MFHRTSVSTRVSTRVTTGVTTGRPGLQDPKCSSTLFSVPNDPKEAAPGIKEANMLAEGSEVTHALKKESDGVVSETKDHHCG